jgi:hypothetical protein
MLMMEDPEDTLELLTRGATIYAICPRCKQVIDEKKEKTKRWRAKVDKYFAEKAGAQGDGK